MIDTAGVNQQRVGASRWVLAFLACVVTAYLVACACQSLLIMAALQGAGAEFSPATRLQVIGHDIVGLATASEFPFGWSLAIGFLIALPTAAVLLHFVPLPPTVAYALAGIVNVAVILAITQAKFFYNMTFMEGTRGVLGYSLQLAAGALGGIVFARLSRRGRGRE